MRSFVARLDDILAEMPVRRVYHDPNPKVVDKTRTGRNQQVYNKASHFGRETAKAYSSLKFYEEVSRKLSKFSKFPINYFVYGRYPFPIHNFKDGIRLDNITELSKLSGVPEGDMRDAINIIITGDNAQLAMSPWMLLHQVAEGIVREHGDIDDNGGGVGDIFDEYYEYFKVHLGRGKVSTLFAMKSARDGVMIDVLQELITEYLWHAGRIRRRYPDGCDKKIVDEFVDRITLAVENLLESCVGGVFFNSD